MGYSSSISASSDINNNNKHGGPDSVRFVYGSCMGRFEQFRFSVLTVPLWKQSLSTSIEF